MPRADLWEKTPSSINLFLQPLADVSDCSIMLRKQFEEKSSYQQPQPPPPPPAVEVVLPLDPEMGYMMFVYPARFLFVLSRE